VTKKLCGKMSGNGYIAFQFSHLTRDNYENCVFESIARVSLIRGFSEATKMKKWCLEKINGHLLKTRKND